ncbi:Fanconi anemia group J protein-like protein [Auxenochlorella protothecoides]|uniref:Regulator of telomere elongation helicase 1 homolog n=1 Tax=Auxenochlorella protothecoides TaxID=3075 RepID=A0A087SBC5_AUXPR|nr:Fanconi anemia group J protein-like protein [Auxenochlorella protothecoides]KFM23029.1 Fanconi anemia group J protein-like protein [Auxenochlorella protothecoides]
MGTPTQYKIGGCDVVFPHQAYGVQLSFMNKCSGKTLSLLCSSLAWQQREKKRIEDGLPSAYPPSAAPPPEAPAPGLATEIAQVVAELRRSSYRPRMAILASKKHYCVNKFALSKPSIEEACDELLKEGQCSYFKGTQAVVSSGYSSRMLIIKALQVHDIEELRSFARGQRACPYFLASKWSKVVGLCIEMREADMVFSPYSYLVDPVIRRALDISVEGNMLVFDEAHNMEDVAREAASMHLPAPEVLEIQTSFARAVAMNGKPEVYAPLADALLRLHEWLVAREADVAQGVIRIQKQNRFEKEEVVWQGPQLLAHLKDMALGADAVEALWLAVRVGGKALGQTSRLIQILKLLHEVSTDGSRDFRLVFSRTFMGAEGRRGGALRFRRGGDEAGSQWVSAVSLWCLNPEVVFKSLSELAHSTVLTSGTLAPLEGFASELGTPFDVRLEAPHVVDMARQVWAGVIGMAPCRTQLNGVFRNVSTEAYQDGVGASVLALVGIVPDGVLLFFPSYSLLERLTQRWQTTGLWKRLASAKPIVTEPRGGGPEALAEVMKSYYDGVAAGKGGLFMAVSEGLDFADANARAVIIVGLPYPAAYDKQVLEKKAYNDAGRARGLLSGSAWYSQQAFRALNQAIGRCIRHRADWGAIVLLDSRFEAPANQRGLSRWVRGSLTVQPSFDAALGSLRAFFERLAADTASFLAFLEASGCTLAAVGARYASLEAVAQDAVLDCFAAASEWLGDGKTLEQLAAVWKPCLPRGLLAAMGAGDADVAGGQVGSTGWCDAM